MNIRGTPKHSTSRLESTPDWIWELECDFANSEYLRASVMQKIVTSECTEKSAILHDQLHIQNCHLKELCRQKRDVQKHLANIQLQQQLQFCLQILNDVIEKFHKLTSEQDLKNNIDFIYEKLYDVYNRIELKNIKPLVSQEDYNHLIVLIAKCNENINKIFRLTKNMDDVKKLADCLEMYKHLQKSIKKELQVLCQLEDETTYFVLKSASDKMCCN